MTENATLPELLRSVGHKVTPQRLAVLTTLRDSERHMTAAEIIQSSSPGFGHVIDQSTVYRILFAAEQAGLVTRFSGHGDEIEFEWLGGHAHHHLLCDACGGVTTLDAERLSQLRGTLLKSEGFELDVRHLALRGTCAGCRQPHA